MKEIRIKCPAKINLTLEILNKREDRFHNIQSIMQTIDLFDILTIKVVASPELKIKLSGTSNEIPYDEKNLVYKAAQLYMDSIGSLPFEISIHIEKSIPIAAGLAGGSTDAAGTLYGLNKIFNEALPSREIHDICAKLGSDLNFCLEGGCQLATGRGEILKELPFKEFELSLIKPKQLGISAKEAYTKFSDLEIKPNLDMTSKFISAIKKGHADIQNFLQNDLETALVNEYKDLKKIKTNFPYSIMSGSGSTFFVLKEDFKNFDNSYWVKNRLKSIPYGVCEDK